MTLKSENLGKLNESEWKKLLLDEELLSSCNYLGYCVNETLRIDPSLRFSTIHEIVGKCKLGQYDILDKQRVVIYMYGMHHNP